VLQPGELPSGLVKVQQGVGDVGPLHVDLRVQPLDLRSPLGYDAVYRGQTTNSFGVSTDYFARISGAVTAVFPHSVYTELGDGIRSADVPAGTVYYIGALPPELAGQPEPPPRVIQRPPIPVASGPDVFTELPFDPAIERLSAQHRADLAADLIHRAAEAEKARIQH
jgi:hypothetical protein